jgi:hypothetical protein
MRYVTQEWLTVGVLRGEERRRSNGRIEKATSSVASYELLLLNSVTSFEKSTLLMKLLLLTCYPLPSNFHRQLHTAPYERSRPQSIHEVTFVRVWPSPYTSYNKLKILVAVLFSFRRSLVLIRLHVLLVKHDCGKLRKKVAQVITWHSVNETGCDLARSWRRGSRVSSILCMHCGVWLEWPHQSAWLMRGNGELGTAYGMLESSEMEAEMGVNGS